MAILTNLDAIRGTGLDDMIRRVHLDKEDFVIEDQTMSVAAVIDINKYQMLEEMQQKQQGAVKVSSGEPVVRGSNISIREVATRHLMGDTIDQLKHRFPQLNPGQLFGALAYYYDHADEIDSLIAAKRAARAAAGPATHVSSPADADMRPEG